MNEQMNEWMNEWMILIQLKIHISANQVLKHFCGAFWVRIFALF